MRIHCTQHYCKHYCACQFCRSSRYTVYKHQLPKHMTEEHGGPEGLLYCVDRESYQAFCEAMGWQDPAEFGTPQPTRTGHVLWLLGPPLPHPGRYPQSKWMSDCIWASNTHVPIKRWTSLKKQKKKRTPHQMITTKRLLHSGPHVRPPHY